ncbi:hypothetical protein HDU79_000917 [Rhizoclosmatium sp. JEL0117]|nr:hypothetical protein HDU79_000917 [Rhizoclosmatium sp. JEL0117]
MQPLQHIQQLYHEAVYDTVVSSSDESLDKFARSIQTLNAPTNESESKPSTSPQSIVTDLCESFLNPFAAIESKYSQTIPTEMRARAWWIQTVRSLEATNEDCTDILGGAVPPPEVSSQEWELLWRWRCSVVKTVFDGCVDEKAKTKAVDAIIKSKMMSLKMKEAQLTLVVLLEVLRIHRLHSTITLPELKLFPKQDADSEEDDDDGSNSPTSRYSKRKRALSKRKSKKQKQSFDDDDASEEDRLAAYVAATVQLFDRMMIWDSLFFQTLENNEDSAVGAQFRNYLFDLKNIVESLFIKAGIQPPLVKRPSSSSTTSKKSGTATTPRGRGVAASKKNTQSQSNTSVLRRMSRASSMLQISSSTNASQESNDSISNDKFQPVRRSSSLRSSQQSLPESLTNTSETSTSGFSAATLALAAKGRNSRKLSTLSNRVVSLKPKDTLSAGDKAKQVLLKKMNSQLESEENGNLPPKPPTVAATGKQRGTKEEKEAILKAKEEKLLKAAALMTKRMSGGSAMLPVPFSSVSKRVASSGALLASQKEKLKNDLKLTERLRGPDLILRPGRVNENTLPVEASQEKPEPALEPTQPIPSTPTTQRTRNAKLTLPLLNSGKKIAADFQNVDWNDIENSCTFGGNEKPVSDSPIKDVYQERPAERLKVRSAKKRMVARFMDIDSLFQ